MPAAGVHAQAAAHARLCVQQPGHAARIGHVAVAVPVALLLSALAGCVSEEAPPPARPPDLVLVSGVSEVDGNARLQRLIGFSCAWLDQAAGGDFARADEGLRDGILETMSALPWEAPQRRFFDLMRDVAMGYFYSQPAALKGMATDQPPQPGGYFISLE